jgi:uncharacterized integral membrane protein
LHCSKCGAQNAEGSKFCSKCGNNLVPQPEDNSLTKLEIEEVRRFERRGWMVTIVGLIIVVIGLLVGVGSTATRYIGNFEYETYHPNAEIGMIIVVGGFVIALIGAIGVTFYHNKRLQLTKRLK